MMGSITLPFLPGGFILFSFWSFFMNVWLTFTASTPIEIEHKRSNIVVQMDIGVSMFFSYKHVQTKPAIVLFKLLRIYLLEDWVHLCFRLTIPNLISNLLFISNWSNIRRWNKFYNSLLCLNHITKYRMANAKKASHGWF